MIEKLKSLLESLLVKVGLKKPAKKTRAKKRNGLEWTLVLYGDEWNPAVLCLGIRSENGSILSRWDPD